MGNEIYFNAVANDWDAMRKEFFPDSIRELACEYASVKKGQKVIDFGAGTGFLSEILIEKGLEVTAIDQSNEMIAILRKKFYTIKKFKTILANGETKNLGLTSFDHAFSNMYLHHTEDPEKAIKTMADSLKAGGKLVIIDLFKHNHDFLIKEHNDRWPGFEKNDIKKWFSNAGLKSINIKGLQEKCSSTSKETEDKAAIQIFIAIGEKM